MTKDEINVWCKTHKINGFNINSDLTVDVAGSVNLENRTTDIPFKFNNIIGSFYCGNNQLTTLKNCPEKVRGSFGCSHNKLTSLEYCPRYIGKGFLFKHNNITSFDYFPLYVGNNVWCSEITTRQSISKVNKLAGGFIQLVFWKF